MNKVLIVIVLFLIPLKIFPADNLYGLHVGGSYNIHYIKDKFSNAETICCADFMQETAYGSGANLEAIYEARLGKDHFIDCRLGLSYLSGSINSYTDNVLITFDSVSIPISRRDSLDMNIISLRFIPSLKYRLFNNLNMSVGLGCSFILKAGYKRSEKILNPSELLYSYDYKEHTTLEGDVEGQNRLSFFLVYNLSYDFEIGKNLTLSPELRFCLPLTYLSEDDNYLVSCLQGGISIKFGKYR